MLSDLQLVYMGPRNSTELLKINTTKFQVEREPVYPIVKYKYYQISSGACLLGVELSLDLRWNTHVRKTASKANQTLGVLRRNLKNCPREIKNMAYKSILRPKMKYAAPIWDPYTKDNIQLLEAVQRRAARFVCNNYSRHESVTSMLQDLDWPLLEQRRAESRLTLFHRIVHKEVDINEHALMERNPRASRKGNSVQYGPRLLRTVSSTPSFESFHIPVPSLSGMLYLQVMICHSSNPKSRLLTCVVAVHSTNHALTAVIMILKDSNSLHIKIKIKIKSQSNDQLVNCTIAAHHVYSLVLF